RHGAAPIRGAGPHTERISGTPPRVALDMRPRRFDIQRAANPPGRAALVASRNGTAPETGLARTTPQQVAFRNARGRGRGRQLTRPRVSPVLTGVQRGSIRPELRRWRHQPAG